MTWSQFPHPRCLEASRHLAAAFMVSSAACSTVQHAPTGDPNASKVFLFESFDHAREIAQTWSSVIPEALGASVSFDDGTAQVTSPAAGEVRLRRAIDVQALRNRRIRISARTKTEDLDADVYLAFITDSVSSTTQSLVRTDGKPSHTWTTIDTSLEIAVDSLRSEVDLVFHGKGHAWFDDVRIEVIGQAPDRAEPTLSMQQLENVQALARAAALIRFRDPADETTAIDWDRFVPFAIERVLGANTRTELQHVLHDVFGPIAPAIIFSTTATSGSLEPARDHGDHLVRWRHHGVSNRPPFAMWREGRDPDRALLDVQALIAVPDLAHCRRPRVVASVPEHGEHGATMYAQINQPGQVGKWINHELSDGPTSAMDLEIPPDAVEIKLGLEITGRTEVELEQLSLTCDGHEVGRALAASAAWESSGHPDLYSTQKAPCGHTQCLSIKRRPLNDVFDRTRDEMHAQLAPGLWMHMPLAVSADDHQTWPPAAAWHPSASQGPSERSRRLAVIANAWSALWLFYPYLHDQKIDWPAVLPASLTAAAAAHSLKDTYRALATMLVKLKDNHARVIHPAFSLDGIEPIIMRRFGDQLIVTGTTDDYAATIPIGSQVVAIDGVSASQAFSDLSARTPAATPGWQESIVPFWLTIGPPGTFSTVRIKQGDSERDVVLPRRSRDVYDPLVHEPRPTFGAEVAPGTFYVDLSWLAIERWQSVLPTLRGAHAIILDMRGYPTNHVFSVLGHFTDHEIRSPSFLVPILESGGDETSSWTIRPRAPRLNAKVFVLLDGRAGSAAETVLQIVKENHLATLVGEPSGGTNGNVQTFALPEGFSIRFTGLRVLLQDGTPIQGHGIAPDVVAHPTLAGIRAGRDELLEAAIALAKS